MYAYFSASIVIIYKLQVFPLHCTTPNLLRIGVLNFIYATTASVAKNRVATDDTFCRAERVTFVGSTFRSQLLGNYNIPIKSYLFHCKVYVVNINFSSLKISCTLKFCPKNLKTTTH